VVHARCPTCNTRFKVPEDKLGRRVRCRKCAAVFQIVSDERPLVAPSLDDLPLEQLARGETVANAPTAAPVVAPSSAPLGAATALPDLPPANNDAPRPSVLALLTGYIRAIAAAPLVMFKPSCIGVLAMICVLKLLAEATSVGICFLWIVFLILQGWYVTYLLSVVVSGAANDDSLPGMTMDGGFIDGVVLPLLKFVSTVLFSLAPLAVVLIASVVNEQLDLEPAVTAWVQALTFKFSGLLELDAQTQLAAWPALIVGLVFQPMMLLIVAVDSVRSLVRVDLMAVTMIKAAPGYVVLLLVCAACTTAPVLAALSLLPLIAVAEGLGWGARLSLAALTVCLQVLFSVFQMYVTGLFYHHFKSRFAWSWG
jgi:predicted Zn finger-like uncharacterized protein